MLVTKWQLAALDQTAYASLAPILHASLLGIPMTQQLMHVLPHTNLLLHFSYFSYLFPQLKQKFKQIATSKARGGKPDYKVRESEHIRSLAE
jgi:hypothetical protein